MSFGTLNIRGLALFSYASLVFDRPAKRKRIATDQSFLDAVVLSWKRCVTLPVVVRSLAAQRCIRKIYVWHNRPSWLRIPGVINIFSDENLKCLIRHGLALGLESEHLLFIDDDLYLSQDCSNELTGAYGSYGESCVIGPFGRVLQDSDLPYSEGKHLGGVAKSVATDIVLGRMHMVRRKNIVRAWNMAGELHLTNRQREEDDVILNMGLQLSSGTPSVVVPISGLKELPRPHSRCAQPGHHRTRDEVVVSFRKHGWRSLRK